MKHVKVLSAEKPALAQDVSYLSLKEWFLAALSGFKIAPIDQKAWIRAQKNDLLQN